MEVRSKLQSNPNALPSPERSAPADRDAMRLIEGPCQPKDKLIRLKVRVPCGWTTSAIWQFL